jgi:hypothetical protein
MYSPGNSTNSLMAIHRDEPSNHAARGRLPRMFLLRARMSANFLPRWTVRVVVAKALAASSAARCSGRLAPLARSVSLGRSCHAPVFAWPRLVFDDQMMAYAIKADARYLFIKQSGSHHDTCSGPRNKSQREVARKLADAGQGQGSRAGTWRPEPEGRAGAAVNSGNFGDRCPLRCNCRLPNRTARHKPIVPSAEGLHMDPL